MRLAVTAPFSEIDKSKNQLLLQILISLAVISTLAVFVTVLITRRMVKPLKELNTAAKKIAAGDLSISLTPVSYTHLLRCKSGGDRRTAYAGNPLS